MMRSARPGRTARLNVTAAAGRSTRIGIKPDKEQLETNPNKDYQYTRGEGFIYPGRKYIFPWGASGYAQHPEPGTFPGASPTSPLADVSDDDYAMFMDREIFHGRWAMLGICGMWAQENAGFGPWFDVYTGCQNGACELSYGGNSYGSVDQYALLVVNALIIGYAEACRGGLIPLPGTIVADMAKTSTKTSGTIYPGGGFDPLGLASPKKETFWRGKKADGSGIEIGGTTAWAPFAKSGEDIDSLKLKELKHGRLAMMACAGCFGQSFATNGGEWVGGHGPVENFSAHINNVVFCNAIDQSGCVY